VDVPERSDLLAAKVTSECLSPTLGKRLALGFAHSESNPENLVRLSDGRTARVVALPFYDPRRRRPRAAPF
jgi:glycine cleavage system aminomethyltransferase T